MKRPPRGFTLIEMLVVMAIVALLLTIALPRYFGSLDKARDAALHENLKVLRASLDRFQADRGRRPETLEELVEHRYLRAVPVDPVTESATTWILVGDRDGTEKGILDVKSGAPGQSRDGQAYAAF